MEFERNRERYEFLRWGQKAFDNFRVVPPTIGIVHQVNLEYLAKGVFLRQDADGPGRRARHARRHRQPHDDDQRLGVLGWGVGGIEAEAVMLGQPLYMLAARSGRLRNHRRIAPGTTATDLVLTVTQILRKEGVVGKFVEFFGPALSQMKLADRATIGNMAPEYGATMGFFPIDERDAALSAAHRPHAPRGALVERYYKEQGTVPHRRHRPSRNSQQALNARSGHGRAAHGRAEAAAGSRGAGRR